tara:strand:+ start:384 stop:569 length:186 start_codon:yes stop_codon:yes gene_type:complete
MLTKEQRIRRHTSAPKVDVRGASAKTSKGEGISQGANKIYKEVKIGNETFYTQMVTKEGKE